MSQMRDLNCNLGATLGEWGYVGQRSSIEKGPKNSYEHNTWKISKPQKGRILDPTEMIIRESKLAISCLSFCP